jgi:hypothetical protein
MKEMFEGVLYRYGTPAKLYARWGTRQLRVFFYPASSAWQRTERMITPLGEVPGGKYFCVLPADLNIVPDDVLEIGGRSYLLHRVEQRMLLGEEIYQWALCVEKGSEDTWGINGSTE